uniref:Uncharacterized protein n=1 Tax=Tetranychus urticae TaxID=32264 RepID=T1KLS7_TETUR
MNCVQLTELPSPIANHFTSVLIAERIKELRQAQQANYVTTFMFLSTLSVL